MVDSIERKPRKISDYIFFGGIIAGIFLILLSFIYGINFGIVGSLIICFFIFLEIFFLLKH
ncbi:MAG TPA: hypothetical protein ENI33_09580 [Thermoplasmatales archaeon]|nr:hypothetical protein [Thermoplasmatales archaeon]